MTVHHFFSPQHWVLPQCRNKNNNLKSHLVYITALWELSIMPSNLGINSLHFKWEMRSNRVRRKDSETGENSKEQCWNSNWSSGPRQVRFDKFEGHLYLLSAICLKKNGGVSWFRRAQLIYKSESVLEIHDQIASLPTWSTKEYNHSSPSPRDCYFLRP